MPDTIFILFLALILFGPKKLPQIGREIGKFLAEFRRASNSFKSQIQSEMEKAGVDVGMLQGGQQSNPFAQSFLPPEIKSVLSEVDSAHDRLMKTARMAFDAQNFTANPTAPSVAVGTPSEVVSAPPTAQIEAPVVETSSAVTSHEESPAVAVTSQPTPDPAPEMSNSAQQSS